MGGRGVASMLRVGFVLLAAAAVVVTGSIYPDDHWKHSTKLTTENADEVIKKNVDAGKTLFVRWIASEG